MKTGIYIHVPFCIKKCAYCDFYSVKANEEYIDAYTQSVIRHIQSYKSENISADTVYFGGGTPCLLGGKRMAQILGAVNDCFLLCDPEITVEVNPAATNDEYFRQIAFAGVNRISIGMQSANNSELALLTRLHTFGDTQSTVASARRAGIGNISLDVMFCLPGQTETSLGYTLDSCKHLGADHVSAYMLKIEEGTHFYDIRHTLDIPDDDRQAELYLFAADRLESLGYMQYEISNFAANGKMSRHNLKYWRDEEYIGMGPSAHSFYKGERFFYPRDLDGFIRGNAPIHDSKVGGIDEYIMLKLRLTEGISRADLSNKFSNSDEVFGRMLAAAKPLENAGLCECDGEHIRLTRRGFLVSNGIIARLTEAL